METMMVFSLSCTSRVRDDAVGKLGVFFEITLGNLIDSGAMGWLDEPKRRPFVLSCTAFLAVRADALATERGTEITPDILDSAAKDMIQAKESDCPLPPHVLLDPALEILGSACKSLGGIIHGQLVGD